MKERVDKILSDEKTKAKLTAFAQRFKHWFGKTPRDRTFEITEGSIVAVAALCGETSVVAFFDGEDLTVAGKKVTAYFAELEGYRIAEKLPATLGTVSSAGEPVTSKYKHPTK